MHQLFYLPFNLLFSTLEACSIFPSADREGLYHHHLLSGRWIWQSNLNFLTAVFIYLSSKLFPLKHRGVGLNRHTSLQLEEVWYLHMLSLETTHFSITEVSELQAILGSQLCFNDSWLLLCMEGKAGLKCSKLACRNWEIITPFMLWICLTTLAPVPRHFSVTHLQFSSDYTSKEHIALCCLTVTHTG